MIAPSQITTYLNNLGLPCDDGSLQIISDTNNPVYLFSSGAKKFIFKLIQDTDIELNFLKYCSDHLKKIVPVQNIQHIDQSLSDFALPVVISEYATGRDVAAILESGEYSKEFESAFTDFLILITNSVNEIPPPAKGFGAYKTNRSLFNTFEEAIDFSLERYAGKFHRLLPDSPEWLHVYRVMESCANKVIKSANADFCVVALDMNLKNFLWEKDAGFTLINIPITGYTHITMGIGEALSHLDGYAYSTFWNKIQIINANQSASFFQRILYAETLGLLGSLSAAVGTDPQKIDSTLCWGYKANIKNRILNNISKIDAFLTEYN